MSTKDFWATRKGKEIIEQAKAGTLPSGWYRRRPDPSRRRGGGPAVGDTSGPSQMFTGASWEVLARVYRKGMARGFWVAVPGDIVAAALQEEE